MAENKNLCKFLKISQEDWEKEWQGMPEFVSNDLMPKKQLIINFSSYEDVEKFSQLIGQSITKKTKSIWYPKAQIRSVCKKRYVDES